MGATTTTAHAVPTTTTTITPNHDAQSPQTTIQWGIVGLGDVCQKKSGPAFWKCNGSSLVAVMRRSPGKAAEFAKQVPGGHCVGYDNLDDFLKHPELEAVYVSTRPGTHFDICKKVALAGKACYVEKPVGRCAEETQAIANLFVDKPLYTAYISRAYERTQAVRRLLKNGAIGKLESVNYHLIGTGGARDMNGTLPWRLDASQSGGGLLLDVGCHVLDRIDYLCGPLVNVVGTAKNLHSSQQAVEDFVHLTAKIGKDAAVPGLQDAMVECTWEFASTSSRPQDELSFVGSQGSIRMEAMQAAAPVAVYDGTGKLIQELVFEMPEHTAQPMIQAITDNLRGVDKKDCLSFGENAIRTANVMDMALNSYYGGREIGFWNRENTWPGRSKSSSS